MSTKLALWSRVNTMAAVVTCQQNGRCGHMSTKWPLWSHVNKMAAVVKDVKVAAVCNRVGEMLLISRG